MDILILIGGFTILCLMVRAPSFERRPDMPG